MTLQVLVATMHRTDHSLLDKMNIQTDAVIVNQCDEDRVESFERNGHRVLWINTRERGVGRSRNRAILAADADILLFADDDVVYEDGLEQTVGGYFAAHPAAALVTFNLTSLNPERPEPIVRADYRLRLWNCLKFGAFRIAVRREAILRHTLFYSLCFGGGAPHRAGEDNLFITQCLQRGLTGYAAAVTIGTVAQTESTWFAGYDDTYYRDRGALFSVMYGGRASLMLLLFELRRPNRDLLRRYRLELAGARAYRRLQTD